MSEREKLSRTVSSSSSTASSCSSFHLPLSKTNRYCSKRVRQLMLPWVCNIWTPFHYSYKDINHCLFLSISTASQDSGGLFLVKSGSVSRSGTTTWASPVAETAAPSHQNTTSSSSPSVNPCPVVISNTSTACSSAPNQGPAPLPKATGPAPSTGQIRSPTQKQSSDQGQLEPIFEAPPDSPRALVKISSPYKRKSKSTVPNGCLNGCWPCSKTHGIVELGYSQDIFWGGGDWFPSSTQITGSYISHDANRLG